jgi:thioesterase domain-containing protein
VGLCVFGNLALEAARQLRAEGETVELVVLNDSLPPGYREDMPWLKRQMHAWRVRAQDLELDVQRIQRGERTAGEVIASYTILRQLKLVQLGAKLHVLRPSVIEDVRRLENRWFTDYCLHSQSYYRPAPYDGDVLILRSEEASLGHLYAADLGWDYRITGRVNALQCPGMHAEMFRVAGSEVMAKAIIERTRPRR